MECLKEICVIPIQHLRDVPYCPIGICAISGEYLRDT
ncbi:hypothetical protein ADUPG1_001928, partial [Aduncisulcus paluster]